MLFFSALAAEPWFSQKPLAFYHQPGKGNAIFWLFNKTWTKGYDKGKLYKKTDSGWSLLTESLSPIWDTKTFNKHKQLIEVYFSYGKPLTYEKFKKILVAKEKTGYLDGLLVSSPEIGKISSCEFFDPDGKKKDEYKLELFRGMRKTEFTIDGAEKTVAKNFEPIKLQNIDLNGNQVRLEFEMPEKRSAIRSIHVYRADKSGQFAKIAAYFPLFSSKPQSFWFDKVKPAPEYSYYLTYATVWDEEVGQSNTISGKQQAEKIAGKFKITKIALNKNAEVEITWPRVLGAEKIFILRNKVGADEMLPYAEVDGNQVSFTDKKPEIGVFNQYQLKVADSTGIITKKSDTRQILGSGNSTVPAVTSLKISADQTSIDLKWDYKSDVAIREFQIFLLEGKQYDSAVHKLSAFVQLKKVPGNKSKLNFQTNLSGWFNFYVVPIAESLESGAPGKVVSIYKENDSKPQAPLNVTALYGEKSHWIQVTWSRNIDSHTKRYVISRDDANSVENLSDGSKLAEIPLQFNYKDTKIKKGKWYRYGVTARGSSGGLFSSTPKSLTTYSKPVYVPDSPERILDIALSREQNNLLLKWQDKNNKRTTYKIYGKVDKDKKYKILGENLTEKTFNLNGAFQRGAKKAEVYVVPVSYDKSIGERSRMIRIDLPKGN